MSPRAPDRRRRPRVDWLRKAGEEGAASAPHTARPEPALLPTRHRPAPSLPPPGTQQRHLRHFPDLRLRSEAHPGALITELPKPRAVLKSSCQQTQITSRDEGT